MKLMETYKINSRIALVLLISTVLLSKGQAQQSNKETENPSTNKTILELTVDLKDGSRLVGTGLIDPLRFHSESLGDLQLPVKGITSLEFSGSTNENATKLTATNGDVMNLQLIGKTFPMETGFGKAIVPVTMLSKVKVTPKSYGGGAELTNSLLSFWNFNGGKTYLVPPDGGRSLSPLRTGNDGRGIVSHGRPVPGKIQGAFAFEQGPFNGLFIPTGEFPLLTTFTITAWVKLDALSAQRSLIACSWDGPDGWNFFMDIYNGQLEGCVGIGGRDNYPRVATTGNFTDSQWHFCVFQCLDASFIRVKVDNGNWVTSSLGGASLAGASPRPFQIAANIAQSVQASNFSIDMLGVWQSVLSDEEVSLLYNNGAGAEYPFAPSTQ